MQTNVAAAPSHRVGHRMTEMATHSLDSAERHAENELLGITQRCPSEVGDPGSSWLLGDPDADFTTTTTTTCCPASLILFAAVTVIWDLPNRRNGPFDIDEGGYFGIVARRSRSGRRGCRGSCPR